MSGLPQEVLDLAELSPVEDLALAVLRDGLPSIQVKSRYAMDQTFPVVVVRRGDSWGDWGADMRFTDSAQLLVYTLCQGPDADEDAALLAEAVRIILRNAWLTQKVIPGKGHFTRVQQSASPRQVPDWATATGPVQYADLPTGVVRYETRYQVGIRRPRDLSI